MSKSPRRLAYQITPTVGGDTRQQAGLQFVFLQTSRKAKIIYNQD